jgi:hypothetical protein
MLCTFELKVCPDGSSVGRTGPNCDFVPCPEPELEDEVADPPVIGCTLELKECPGGGSVGRTGPNCEFEPCPEPQPESESEAADTPVVTCTKELKECPDGSSVGRAGPDCEFEPCPEPQLESDDEDADSVACSTDLLECSDGSFVVREGPICEFQPCPTLVPTSEYTDAELVTGVPSSGLESTSEPTSEAEDLDDFYDVANDDCLDAVRLGVGVTILGTTASASNDTEAEAGVCTADEEALVPEADGFVTLIVQKLGVWYSIEATDRKLRASVCPEEGTSAPAPFIVTVYAGSADCSDLVCASVYNTAGCAVEWVASSDFEMYFLHVQSLVVAGVGDADQEFRLTITEPEPPVNDVCEGAIELEMGDTVASSTLSGCSNDDFDGRCAISIQPPTPYVLIPGVWFSIVGTGNRISASTCNFSSEAGPILVSIYSGSCAGLVCETTEASADPCSAELDSTVDGQVYYILVEKLLLGNNPGAFELTVDS